VKSSHSFSASLPKEKQGCLARVFRCNLRQETDEQSERVIPPRKSELNAEKLIESVRKGEAKFLI
jgi:hypothetical protein